MSDNITEVNIAGVGIINVQGFTCTPVDGSKAKMNGRANYRINKGPETAEGKIMVTKDEYNLYLAGILGTTKAITARNAAWEARTGDTRYFESQTCYLKKDGENKNEMADEATDENVEVTFIPLGEFTNLGQIYAEGEPGEAVA
ncbi:hypothetical protein KAR91_73780 [Candidatus Pacearchaeota archaeon]|nr:hypothetical protein [Candidatus Pacearchaeota archaeon]